MRVDAPEGFDEYVEARREALFRAAYLLTGDRHHAEDLVQATLVRVWQRWRRVSAMESVDAYVRRVQLSIFLSWRRRLLWRESPSAELPETRQDDTTAGLADRLAVVKALSQLPPRQRSVIALRYLLDLSEAETADAMSCSTGTVKRQTFRAMANLRTLLSDVAGEPLLRRSS